jgi:hypothetical protein
MRVSSSARASASLFHQPLIRRSSAIQPYASAPQINAMVAAFDIERQRGRDAASRSGSA